MSPNLKATALGPIFTGRGKVFNAISLYILERLRPVRAMAKGRRISASFGRFDTSIEFTRLSFVMEIYKRIRALLTYNGNRLVIFAGVLPQQHLQLEQKCAQQYDGFLFELRDR